MGRVTSPECLFVEQYFRSVSSRPSSLPLRLRRERIYIRRPLSTFANMVDRISRLFVFADRRPLSIELCHIAKPISAFLARLNKDKLYPGRVCFEFH